MWARKADSSSATGVRGVRGDVLVAVDDELVGVGVGVGGGGEGGVHGGGGGRGDVSLLANCSGMSVDPGLASSQTREPRMKN